MDKIRSQLYSPIVTTDNSTKRILHFLARATSELGTSLNWQETLKQLCHIISPDLAEHCSVWWLGQDGQLSEHKKPNAHFDLTNLIEQEIAHVLTTGVTKLNHIEICSTLTIPMRVKNEIAGVLCLINFNKIFQQVDLVISEELAYRAAMVLDHAQVYENLKTAEEHLQKMRDVADKASKTKSLFLANMSHEIRTPLTAILGFLDVILSSQDNQSTKSQELVDRVKANGAHLLRLIDQILDLSKVESGKIEIFDEEIQLGELLKDVHSALILQAQKKKILFNISFDTPVPVTITIDPTRLKQILLNIIGNAIKFTDQGEVSVNVRYKQDSNQLTFRVRDTGVGLTPEQQQRIFKPFTQGDASHVKRFGGTGLGLTLSRKFAQHMKGDIVLLNSSIDMGTIFEISVDAGCGAKPELSLKILSTEPKVKSEPTPPENLKIDGASILLAEDSPDNQMIIEMILTKAGAKVDLASDGLEAFQKASKKTYDVILMDIQLPIMDGREVCRNLRTQCYKAPIVALTAHALKKEREESLEAGCNDHLTKPIDKVLLIRTIQYYLKEKTLQI